MFQRLLVATDASTLWRNAERHAIELAGAIGAELVVLQVAPRLSRTRLDPTVADRRIECVSCWIRPVSIR